MTCLWLLPESVTARSQTHDPLTTSPALTTTYGIVKSVPDYHHLSLMGATPITLSVGWFVGV